MLTPDTLLQDRYHIVRQVGLRGMGAIYEATDRRLEKSVAVKQILRDDEHLQKAFAREARLLAQLRHPGLPKVIDYFGAADDWFLVMEFIPGLDLEAELAARDSPFALEQVMVWADQLLDVLDYLHRQEPPVLHRDIKPANLKLIGNTILLLDFGLAKGLAHAGSNPASLHGFTLQYAAPEQISGRGTTPRSDLFALAATLYHLLAGQPAANAVQRIESVSNGLGDPLRPLHELNNVVPLTISETLGRALRLEPKQRFPDAASMRHVLHSESEPTAFATGAAPVLIAPPTATPHNLTTALTPLLGRDHEREIVTAYLRQEHPRLVTLTGPGGIGKTRLSLAVARSLLDVFPDGVYVVDLAPLRSVDLVSAAIAEVLDVEEKPARSILESLQEHLRERSVLLILDNFEHLSAAAPVVADLLRACPRLKVLVTSREPLHIQGEQEYPVPPLPLPSLSSLPPLSKLKQYSSITLFMERAQARRPDFVLDARNARTVAEICTRLDGLPLAIELAAVRVKVLSPQSILERLADRFTLLRHQSPDLPDRQRTLERAISWSYELLNAGERILFYRLSIFAGSAGFEAVESVCSLVEAEDVVPLGIEVLDGLSSLADKSLLQVWENEEGVLRFSMLETIRAYAAQQLTASGEEPTIRACHAAHFLLLAKKASLHLMNVGQTEWLTRLAAEHDNMRVAMDWLLRNNQEAALDCAAALWRFWWVRSHLREGLRWLEAALTGTDGPPAVRATALNGASVLARTLGDYKAATRFAEEALPLHREMGDDLGVADALNNLGAIALHQRDYEKARARFSESFALRQHTGDKLTQAGSLNNLGLVMLHQEDYAGAVSACEQSLALYEEAGEKWGTALSLSNLAFAKWKSGVRQSAGEHWQRSLQLFSELGDKEEMATVMEALSWVAAARGDDRLAVQLSAAASAVLQSLDAALLDLDRVEREQNLTWLRERLDEADFAAAWTKGQAMTLEEAVARALEQSGGIA